MTVIGLAHANIVRIQPSVSGAVFRVRKAKRLLVMSLLFVIVVCGFLYVLQMNVSTAQGYKIRTLKNQFNEISELNRALQINISNLQSVSFLQSRVEGMKMVQVRAQGVEYLAYPSVNAVAAK